ncbi:hypothetical protein GBA52_025205 [Prunus armeniaca]|nr:hypothetical protein GBA52_025205 [Prunus armeniaca]
MNLHLRLHFERVEVLKTEANHQKPVTMHPTLQQMVQGPSSFSLTLSYLFTVIAEERKSQCHRGYAIELYFDPALENQVLKAWNVLARRQISTQLIEIESRPHITLFSSPFIEPAKLENVIKAFASKQEPLALSFSSIGSLPHDNNVLFLSPTPSVSLLQFSVPIVRGSEGEKALKFGEEYRTDSWVPCCAVAQEVPKTRMAEAFCVLRDLKLPVAGYANGYWVGGVFACSEFEISLLQQSRQPCHLCARGKAEGFQKKASLLLCRGNIMLLMVFILSTQLVLPIVSCIGCPQPNLGDFTLSDMILIVLTMDNEALHGIVRISCSW